MMTKTLEMYKKLSDEDKNNISAYEIYNSIYIIAKNNDYKISDDEVEDIKELAYYAYLKDEYYNFSPARISDFITESYIAHNVSLDRIGDASWSDLLEAVDNDDYDFCVEQEMER